MIRPSPVVQAYFARMPVDVLAWLEENIQNEVNTLVLTTSERFQVQQGRCQLLTQLHKMIQEAQKPGA